MITKSKAINKRILLFITAITMLITACSENKKSVVLLKANENDMKLEIDTVYYSETRSFPVLLKITNYSDKKALLIFDTAFNKIFKYQVRNLYLTVPNDTFALGLNGTYLVLNEHSITSYIEFEGLVGQGEKMTFRSFKHIDSVFSKGKIEYHFNGIIPSYIDQKNLLAKADTFLVPYALETSTSNAKVVYDIEKKYRRIKSENIP